MAKAINRLALIALGVVTAGVASADITTTVFKPNPTDLNDLDHYYYNTWGFNFKVPEGQYIVSAELKIKNIYDWTKENNDILYINLLDNPALGVKSFYDNQGGGNAFAGKGPLVGTWTDPIGGYARGVDLTFDLGKLGLLDEFQTFAADGRVGFGFDADCHYFNDGVHFTVKTAPVPEPTTMALLAVGGAAAFLRRRKAR
jgi:hypothetical protein